MAKNVIDQLSIEFEAEVTKAVSNSDRLLKMLTDVGNKVSELAGKKVSLGIGAKTGENLQKFGDAIKGMDIDRFKEFAQVTSSLSSIRLGLSEKSGDFVRNFSDAIKEADTAKIYSYGQATQSIQSINLGIGEKTGANLRSFAEALSTVDTDKMMMLSATNANFNKLEGMGIGDKTGKNLQAFSSALNGLDIAKLQQFSQINAMFSGLSLGIGEKTGTNLASFAQGVAMLDLNKLRELARIDFTNMKILADAARSIKGLALALKQLERASERANSSQKSFGRSVKRTGNHAKSSSNALGRLFQSIKRIAFYRAIRSAMKAITEGFAEGIENLYYWSQTVGSSFAPRMDQLATATQYLKNGFASMFSPLIEYAIPILDRVIDRLVDFFNFIQEGFAQITGAPTWNKALKYPVQYADSLDTASASAKELKHQLLGFDELNVLNTPTDSARGSDKDAKDYGAMFELVETAAGENLKGIGARLADEINSIFDDPEKWKELGGNVADFIIEGFNNIIDFVDGVDWENVGRSLGEFASELATRLAVKIKDTDWGDVVIKFTNAICGIITGAGESDIIDALKKLLASIFSALPSLAIAGLESALKVTASLLRALGWEKGADWLDNMGNKLADFRHDYEAWRKLGLEAYFNKLDYGSALPTTTRGYGYDPTQDNGRSFGTSGAVIGARDSDDGLELAFNVKTLLNDEENSITQIVSKVKTFHENIKKAFGNIVATVGLAFAVTGKLLSEVWEKIKKWFEDNVVPVAWELALAFKDKVWELYTKIREFFEKNPSPVAWIFNVVGGLIKKVQELYGKIKTWFEQNPTPIAWLFNKLGFGDKLKEWNEKIKSWFTTNPTPIAWIFNKLGFGDKLKEWNEKIKTWFSTNPTPIAWVFNALGFGDKLKAWNDKIKNWFVTNPSPIAWVFNVIGGLATKASELWGQIKEWFTTRPAQIGTAIITTATAIQNGYSKFTQDWGTKWADIKSRITSIATAIYNGWKSFTDNWGTNKYADVKSRITSIWEAINTGWQSLLEKWGTWRTLAVGIVFNIGSALADAWSNIWQTWNNSDRTLHFNVKQRAKGGFIDGYASGGFPSPSSGTLFWAGEGGVPEILGTIGGRNAVAGGAEITGIRDAIFQQAESERQLLGQLIRAVNSKDLTLTANSSAGRWVSKALKAYTGVTG